MAKVELVTESTETRLAREFMDDFTPDARSSIGVTEFLAEAFAWLRDRTVDPTHTTTAPTLDDTELGYLPAFVRESNHIEGISETTDAHILAHRKFLDGPVTIPALIELVSVLQPDARFRNAVNIPSVRVGNHIAPLSGPDIEDNLRSILAMRDPWEQHIAYETLHPFTDGNGRSGRAVWLHRHWHEEELDALAIRRGFLHSFYYHTLSSVRFASGTLASGRDVKQARGTSPIGPTAAGRDAQQQDTP